MKIAIVIHEYPPVGGGAATAAAQTARALAAEGHEILVITGGGRGLPVEERDRSVRVERLPALRFRALAPSRLELLSFCASAWLGLERRLRAFAAEGVLAYFAIPAGPFAVRAADRLRIPVVVSVRGSDVPGFRSGRLDGPLGPLVHPMIRWTLARADAVTPNSEILRDLVLRFMPEISERVGMVPNGIEEDAIADRPASSADDGELRVIQVGQLIERKRVDLSLDVIARLRAAGTPARLTVVGDGPLRDALKTQARRLGVETWVDLVGHLPRAEILRELRRHDVFLMTSLAEGMSNALLEAMASGLPIVTTQSGSHDLVEKSGCGFVVSTDDVERLTSAVATLAADRTRRDAMARAALGHARTLTWPACARAFVERLEGARR